MACLIASTERWSAHAFSGASLAATVSRLVTHACLAWRHYELQVWWAGSPAGPAATLLPGFKDQRHRLRQRIELVWHTRCCFLGCVRPNHLARHSSGWCCRPVRARLCTLAQTSPQQLCNCLLLLLSAALQAATHRAPSAPALVCHQWPSTVTVCRAALMCRCMHWLQDLGLLMWRSTWGWCSRQGERRVLQRHQIMVRRAAALPIACMPLSHETCGACAGRHSGAAGCSRRKGGC